MPGSHQSSLTKALSDLQDKARMRLGSEKMQVWSVSTVIHRTNLNWHIFCSNNPAIMGQASWHGLGWDGIRWIRVVGGGGNNYLRPKLVAGLRFCALVRMWKRKRECEQRLNNCPPTSPIPTTITTTTTSPPPPPHYRPTWCLSSPESSP